MDIKKLLRNLVTNTYMPDLDYYSNYIAFQTIYYNPGDFVYCCCTCAFEHEYLDYISDSGEINEEIYEKIVQCIIDGKCPHVEQVHQTHVQETGIYALHIAAALGTAAVLNTANGHRYFYSRNDALTGRLFKLTPYTVALLKNSHALTSVSNIARFISGRTHYLTYAERSNLDNHKITIKQMSILELLVKKKHMKLLQSYLKLHSVDPESFFAALKITFEHNLKDIQALLQSKPSSINRSTLSANCCELCIVYNQHDVLDMLLKHLSFLRNVGTGGLRREVAINKRRLSKACYVLQRKECERILTKYDIVTVLDMSNVKRAKTLFNLLKFYPNFEDEILYQLKQISAPVDDTSHSDGFGGDSILKTVPKFFKNLAEKISFRKDNRHKNKYQEILWRGNWLNVYVKEKDTKHCCRVLKTMIDCGANVNCTDAAGMTPLIYSLTNFQHSMNERQIVELLIYENPDYQLHQSAVSIAIKRNKPDPVLPISAISGDLLMDARPHGWFGHDDLDDCALNFMAPLLIECGFPVSTDTDIILESLREFINKAERDYILGYLKTPKLLTLICRDTLRKHFKGRFIHHYVSISDIPQKIQDFILLKPLLKCVPDDLICR